MSKLQEAKELRSGKVNKIEKIKALKAPIDVYNKLDFFAKNGYESISSEDKSYFLKCFGIFEKEKVYGPNSFMIRVRIPAGRLNQAQAKMIGQIAQKYGKNHIDITTRQQVELRHLSIEDLPTILRDLESVEITTFQTGIDNIRNIITSPLDGVGKDCVIECMPIVEQLQEIFLKNKEWIGTLARKFNTSILGNRSNDCNVYGHDCCFVLAKKGDDLGFNLYLGGKVGVQAVCVDLFVKPDEVADLYRATLEVFKEYGFRDNRNKNRLYFLIQSVGIEEFVKEIRSRVGSGCSSAGELLVDSETVVPNNSTVALKDDMFALHFALPSGVLSGTDLIEASDLLDDNSSIRLSVEQDFFIIDLSQNGVDKIKQSELYRRFLPYANMYFRNQIACVGEEGCVFGVVSSKEYAKQISIFLQNRLPLDDAKIRLYYSACPKGCGIHGAGDIGIEGCGSGKVNIYLGGKVTKSAGEARVIAKKLSLDEAKDAIEKLVTIYKNERNKKESFEEFDSRVLSKLDADEILI